MRQTASKPQVETATQSDLGEDLRPELALGDFPERQIARLRLLWERRRFLLRACAIGLLVSTLVAFLIPPSYTATTQLMPPDPQSTSDMAMMFGLASKTVGGLGSMAGDLLGLKSSGALFIGVLRSQTSQDRLIGEFDLRRVYGKKLVTDARTKLDENTTISEDRKSGIISISVTDHDPKRAAALADGYVNQLNSLVAQLSTSAAHRERVFLEERLKVASHDLDDASNQLAQFSSKNNMLDVKEEGRAMLDAVGALAGELIAAQSELEGLRQIYSDRNSRVRSLNARVAELRKQLQRLGGTQANGVNGTAPSTEPAVDREGNQASGMLYPTIQSLPLLGAKYADYYRRAKIQETVYELLTEQYELAKVQEAKETPSVKVLDPATVPEKKSFPSRFLIVFLGTFLAFAISVVCVLGAASWERVDAKDPRKLFLQEVARGLKTQSPWAPQNGGGPRSRAQRIWNRLGSRRPPTNGVDER